ncbi:MAG: hypothetical protein A3K04_03190 [Gallionellales bacterium RBG_16_56_9]|nr:MAG: hypothetical protein A3K04_03190 [Gallionellales bacterium RBG_16_56_9]
MNRAHSSLKEILLASALLQICACQPAIPPATAPVELFEQQRGALNQAGQLEQQMQQQLDSRMQASDAEQR